MKQLLTETVVAKGRILESDRGALPKGVLCRVQYPVCHLDALNENGRKYRSEVWEAVHAKPRIQEKMRDRILWGHAEHPEASQSSTLDVSHIVTESVIGEDNNQPCLMQTMDVLDTPAGRIVNTLLEAECKLGVSTRAEGELKECIEESSGDKYLDVLPESYDYYATDFTADPSNTGAIPRDRQVSMVESIQAGINEHNLTKEFALKMLGILDCDESKQLLESVSEGSDCSCNPATICVGCNGCDKKTDEGREKPEYKDPTICPECGAKMCEEEDIEGFACAECGHLTDVSDGPLEESKDENATQPEPGQNVGSSVLRGDEPASEALAPVLEAKDDDKKDEEEDDEKKVDESQYPDDDRRVHDEMEAEGADHTLHTSAVDALEGILQDAPADMSDEQIVDIAYGHFDKEAQTQELKDILELELLQMRERPVDEKIEEAFGVGDSISVTMHDNKADPKTVSGRVTKQSADGSFEIEGEDNQKMTIDPDSRSYDISKNMSENIDPIAGSGIPDGEENDPSYDDTPNDPSYNEDLDADGDEPDLSDLDMDPDLAEGVNPDPNDKEDVKIKKLQEQEDVEEGVNPDPNDKEDVKIKKLTEAEVEILLCIDECIVDTTEQVNEDYNDAVSFLTDYFGKADDTQKAKITSLFESKKDANVKLSEARDLMIKEAEARAERDSAIEMAEHLQESCGRNVTSIGELNNLLESALGSKTVNEATVADLKKKIAEAEKVGKRIRRKYIMLEEQTETKLKAATQKVQEEVTRDFVAQYVRSQFDNIGVHLPKTTRALLETCQTFEEVDAISSTVMRSVRENALHYSPGAPTVTSLEQLKVSTGTARLNNVIGDLLTNMRG